MTTMLTARRAASAPPTALWPQVDLLPNEVRAGRRLHRTKRLLALLLIGVVLVAAAFWAYALFTLRDANAELAKAEADTTRLQQEQAQYADVPRIQKQLRAAQEAIGSATSTEVLWKPYFEALRAVTPPGVSYDTMHASVSDDPAANVTTNPLAGPSVGQLTFTARAATLQDVAGWMDAVAAIPGFADPWFTQAAISDEDGTVFFQITGALQLTDAAFAHRFAADGTSTDDTAAEGE